MASLNNSKRKNPQTGKLEPYWRIEWRLDGRKLGRALGFLSAKEAQRLFAAFLLAGGDRQRTPAPSSKPLLRALLSQTLAESARSTAIAAKTKVIAATSTKHLDAHLGGLEVGAVDRAAVAGYVEARQAEGARGRTIQIEIARLRQVLRRAVEDGLLVEVPRLPRVGSGDARPTRWLSAADSTTLIASLTWAEPAGSSLAILVGLELGMRQGEILSRRWEDVRWGQTRFGALHVGTQLDGNGAAVWQTKTRRARTVPLTEAVLLRLREAWAAAGQPVTGWIFASHSASGHLRRFRIALQVACQRAGVPVISPHGLRHSWATRMAIAGVPRATTQALGGWTSPAVLEAVYQHSVTELEAEALHLASLGVAHSSGAQPEIKRRSFFIMRGTR